MDDSKPTVTWENTVTPTDPVRTLVMPTSESCGRERDHLNLQRVSWVSLASEKFMIEKCKCFVSRNQRWGVGRKIPEIWFENSNE